MDHALGGRPGTDIADHPASGYEFSVAECEGRADECTIFPRDVSEETLTTTWITARATDCVNLVSVR